MPRCQGVSANGEGPLSFFSSLSLAATQVLEYAGADVC